MSDALPATSPPSSAPEPAAPEPAAPQPSAPGPLAPKRPSLSARFAAWFARLGRSLVHGIGPGAILDKELRIQGRRVGAYWIRFGYGVIMALFVGLTLANVFTSALQSDGPASLSSIEQLQKSGPIVLVALAWMQFIGVSFASAIFTSPLICEERRAGTLGTLLTTPLTAWQIVVGKACGALVQLLILGLMGLPVLLAVRVFGGISAELVVYTVAILAGATIGNCALGILASTLAPRQSAAIASAILYTLIWYLGPPLLGLAISSAGFTAPWTQLMMFSPGAGMAGLMARLEGQDIFGPTPLPFWAMSFLCSFAVALVAFLIATLRLRVLMRQVGAGRESRPRTRGKQSPDPSNTPADAATNSPLDNTPPDLDPAALAPMTPRERRLAQRRAKRRARVSELAHARAGSRTVGDQPILWRELRQPMSTRRWLTWLGALSMAAIIGYAFWISGDGESVAAVISMLGLVASVMIVCGTAGGALGQERESRSWETLLTTPISPGQIILGKLAGVLMRLRLIWLMVFATILIAIVGSQMRVALLLHMALLLATMSFFVASVGLFFGTVTRRSSVAIIASMASVLGIWLVMPVAGMMCAGLVFRGDDTMLSIVAISNPFAWAGVAMGGARSSVHWDTDYTLFGFGDLTTFQFTLALLLYCGIYAGAGALLLTAARNALAKATLRSGSLSDSAVGPGNVIAG